MSYVHVVNIQLVSYGFTKFSIPSCNSWCQWRINNLVRNVFTPVSYPFGTPYHNNSSHSDRWQYGFLRSPLLPVVLGYSLPDVPHRWTVLDFGTQFSSSVGCHLDNPFTLDFSLDRTGNSWGRLGDVLLYIWDRIRLSSSSVGILILRSGESKDGPFRTVFLNDKQGRSWTSIPGTEDQRRP